MTLPAVQIEKAYFTFIFPFNFKQLRREELMTKLESIDFTFFNLEDEAQQKLFYPSELTVSHQELAQFFYPFIEEKLFPKRHSKQGLFRFSKTFDLQGGLQTSKDSTQFHVNSLDVWFCPANIGMIAVRIELAEAMEISDVIHFARYFRMLEPQVEAEKGAKIKAQDKIYDTFFELLKGELIPFFGKYLVEYEGVLQYGRDVPFFEDKRMYTTALLMTEQGEIDDVNLFRLGQMDSYDKDGQPFMSTTNKQYIQKYIEEHVHNRWAPNAYTVITNQTYMHITNTRVAQKSRSVERFFSTDYYNIMIHYFYKIILLKLSYGHSEIEWEQEKFIVDELIKEIMNFSSHYYFDGVAVYSEGREISTMLRKQFRLAPQYKEIKETLNELYRIIDDHVSERRNKLLFILTIFTVISGIYGMNLVIKELSRGFTWALIHDYTFFEWIALIVILLGVGLSFYLVGHFAYNGMILKRKQRKWQKNR